MSDVLRDRRVLVAITGGIAAYKLGFAVRSLVEAGGEVRVAMTDSAQSFVGPATFEALCGKAVMTGFDSGQGAVDHIELGRWAQVVLVAPATANTLAKMAHGIADNAVTSVLLATRAPIVVAPAMNDGMWEHPATRQNLVTLKERGVTVVGPDSGALAEGYDAIGRMVEPSALVDAVITVLAG